MAKQLGSAVAIGTHPGGPVEVVHCLQRPNLIGVDKDQALARGPFVGIRGRLH